MIKSLLAGAALCAAIAISTVAQATPVNVGVDFSAASVFFTSSWGGSIGYEFQANPGATVVGLAALNPLSGDEQVGLWDANRNLLASTTVTNGSTQIGIANWSYNPITPIALTPGNFYYVAAVGTYSWLAAVNATIDPRISVYQDAWANSGDGFVFPFNVEFGPNSGYVAFPGGQCRVRGCDCRS